MSLLNRRIMLDNGGNEMREWRKIGVKTLGSDEKEILLDIDFSKVNEILMFCKTVSADNVTTSHLDIVFGNDIRIMQSLHATQVRRHYFHAKKISDETWFGSLGFGYDQMPGLSDFSKNCIFSETANVSVIRNTSKVGFKAFVYGGASLKAGTTMEVYGR